MSAAKPPWIGRYQPAPQAPALSQTSGASPYRRGRDFERAVRGQLERRGYFVMRAYGSKGKIDLLAVGKDRPALFIQCKRRGEIGSAEWNEVYEIATAAGGWPIVCMRPSSHKTNFYRLDAVREPRKPGRPWTLINPTDCSIVALPLKLPLAA